MIEIWTKSNKDLPWVETVLRDHLVTTFSVGLDLLPVVARLPGYIAIVNDKQAGLITYRFQEKECEIVTLISTERGQGVGRALIDEVKKMAVVKGCVRLWTIVTNDQLRLLRFLQKRGFSMARIYRNAVLESKGLISGVPIAGENGIPMRDKIELELVLDEYSLPSSEVGRVVRLVGK
jgi:GNAT superfamily N-acetyltransferase